MNNKVGKFLSEHKPIIKSVAVDTIKTVATLYIVASVVIVTAIVLAVVEGSIKSKLDPEGWAKDVAEEEEAEQAELG